MRRRCLHTNDPAEGSIRMIKTTLTLVVSLAAFCGVSAATQPDQGQSATFEVDVTELVDLVAQRQKQNHPTLTVESRRNGSTEHTLSKVHLTIGKARECDVRIGGWRAPRLAATISRKADGFHLVPEPDVEVSVNGTAVSKPWRLDHGDTISLRMELYDIERTIRMNRSATPDNEPGSALGYSVGAWEGDTLVVSTTRVNWPYFDLIGTPLSADVEVIERYSLSDDQSRLNYHFTITDAETFTQPATIQGNRLALGETIPVYDCQTD